MTVTIPLLRGASPSSALGDTREDLAAAGPTDAATFVAAAKTIHTGEHPPETADDLLLLAAHRHVERGHPRGNGRSPDLPGAILSPRAHPRVTEL